jgi:hypothetical protein
MLSEEAGDHVFTRYSQDKDKFMGGFILSSYEVIAIGLGSNISSPPTRGHILDLIKGMWANQTYKEWSGSGITASRRLRRLITLGREIFMA